MPSHKHINFKRGFVRQRIDGFSGHPTLTDSHIRLAKSTAKDACKSVQAYLKSKQSTNFHSSLVLDILNKVDKVIKIQSSHQTEFTFTEEYKIVVSLTACGYAVRIFETMEQDFRKLNDPIAYLESEQKDDIFKYFKDQYFYASTHV